MTSAQPLTDRMNGCFSANRMLAHTAEPISRVAPTAAQPKVSYLALPRRKARKASQRHRLSPMSLQANLDAKPARVKRNDLRKVHVSVDTRQRAACATRRRALARAAPSRPSSPREMVANLVESTKRLSGQDPARPLRWSCGAVRINDRGRWALGRSVCWI